MTAAPPVRLVVICGLPGAGKTTLARELEVSLPAVRLGGDEWMTDLGVDLFDQPFRDRLEARFRDLAAVLLRLGVSVVLDFGVWSRAERDELLALARGLGVAVELRFVDAPIEELWRRVDARNRTDAWPARPITLVVLDFGVWSRAERDELLASARGLGVAVELRFVDAPIEELWRRVDARNRTDAWPARPITRAELDEWSGRFEPPTADELARFDPPA